MLSPTGDLRMLLTSPSLATTAPNTSSQSNENDNAVLMMKRLIVEEVIQAEEEEEEATFSFQLGVHGTLEVVKSIQL